MPRCRTHNVSDIIVGRFTAIFHDFVTNTNGAHLLLDHILLSPGFSAPVGVRKVAGSGTIHHVEYNANTVKNGQNREDRPSDHRPVSVQLQF